MWSAFFMEPKLRFGLVLDSTEKINLELILETFEGYDIIASALKNLWKDRTSVYSSSTSSLPRL